MAISTQITRLSGLRDQIRTKLISMGLVTSSAKLDDCADAIDDAGRGGRFLVRWKCILASFNEGTFPHGKCLSILPEQFRGFVNDDIAKQGIFNLTLLKRFFGSSIFTNQLIR